MKMKILFFLLLLAGIIQFACKKNDYSGPPVITKVRTIDTLKKDSFFIRAIPGNLIVIEGNNLGGLQAVIFNDTPAAFNPAYATNTNVIISIPASAQTAATNPSVQNQIKLVTNHGTTTYTFTLYLPPPSISSLTFDNTGTIVYITGYNFAGIQKITFPITGGPDTALSYTVNKDFTKITALIPPGTVFQDSLRVYCTFGTGSYSYPPPMTITSVSNENAIGGTTITLTGSNFVGIDKVIFPGGIEGTNLQTISVSQLSVTVPAGITTPDSLRIMGVLGSATASQLFDSYITHPSPGYLCSFGAQYTSDNTGFVGWTGGYADAPTAATTYPNATDGVGVLLQQSPMPGNTKAGSQGNAGLLQLSDFPWVSNTSAPVSAYSMKFEVYVKNPWSAGAIWIAVGDWYGWSSYTARYAPWSGTTSGTYQPSGWVTATIPLSQFIQGNQFYQNSWNPAGAPASVFNDYPTTGVGFLIVNDQATPNIPANTISLAIDNVRIVKGQ